VLNNDINAIPSELIERIEVLKDGASSVYGSDAIGGVVNFITKTNYQGADFGYNYGISDRNDGERKGYHFTFGQTSDKGSIIAGLDYNKFDGVIAGNRDYSKCAVSLKGGLVRGTPCTTGDGSGGSLASLSGYLYPLNSSAAVSAPYFAACGGAALTTQAGAAGGGGIPAGFRCFNGATDHFNYQAVNLVTTRTCRRTSMYSSTGRIHPAWLRRRRWNCTAPSPLSRDSPTTRSRSPWAVVAMPRIRTDTRFVKLQGLCLPRIASAPTSCCA
jgi:outer membrane receptor protein involved in Fe transport